MLIPDNVFLTVTDALVMPPLGPGVKIEVETILKQKSPIEEKIAAILNINNIWFIQADTFSKSYGFSTLLSDVYKIRDEWLKLNRAKFSSITELKMPLKQPKIA